MTVRISWPTTRHWRRWYDSAAWKKRRAYQLRLHPLCAWCLQQGRVRPAVIADHVISHEGDWNLFVLGELQSLCEQCHNRKSAGGEAYSDEIGIDGYPVDPAHPFNLSKTR
jgi:5-methylcytosine-specific restriction endonuclease McrA